MKTHLVRLSVFAAVMAAAVYAQNARIGKAEIPFDFIAGSQVLPAGQYTVEHLPAILSLRDDAGHVQNIATHGVESLDVSTAGKLVFHRYGDEYFLSEAWVPGSNVGNQLQKTSRERELSARRPIERGIAVVAIK